MKFLERLRGLPRELFLFSTVILVMSFACSVYDSTFNNFINERFQLTGFQRSFLELPREFPGVAIIFASAALYFLCSRRLGAFALLLSLAGALLLGYINTSFGVTTAFIFTYSLGHHLFMPVTQSIGMELAHKGQTGRRLGQLNAIRNFATVLGSFLVSLGFQYLGFEFKTTFTISAIGFGAALLLMLLMKPAPAQRQNHFLKLHREYRLYYVLNILTGMRKQIFLTFGPWVIVSVFGKPTQTIATLLTIGGVIGILFQPLLGRMIDRLGERITLMAEAVLLAVICLGYATAGKLFPAATAFIFICVFYLIDQILMSVNMARSMYMKKIALEEAHVHPALTAGIAFDHIFSIGIALIGGVIWNTWGYEVVFLVGVAVAALNFIASRFIRIPPAGAPAAAE